MGWTLAILALVGAGVASLLIGGWVGRINGIEGEAVEKRGDRRKEEGEV